MTKADKERFLGVPKSMFWSVLGVLTTIAICGGINLVVAQAVAGSDIVTLKEDVVEIKEDVSSIQTDVAAQALEQKELSTNMGHVMDEQKEQGAKLDTILEKLNE